ncbi:multidrug effflux MFS transporter [Chitinophaga costaii]|uniref:multidrug effflux MFS transporter n=1 Tax=Chitinophaga costaii TaxID=1335309 RepID=UPI001F0C92E2|nr:multidrug effflux MFS transporter [Chitinophaga costaii]
MKTFRSFRMDTTKSRSSFLIFILGTLTALGPFSIDMYLPGFPAIAKDLGVRDTEVGLSLSSYFVGIAAGQILYGPLLDRFGRKRPLYIGLAVYILASIGCMLSHSLNSLVILRFVQAVGSCAATVAAVAMVRDIFPVKDNARVFALLMLVVGASPMLAPTIGGYVSAGIGWHYIFAILGGMGILTLIASIWWLPSSYRPDLTLSLKPLPILKNFWLVLREPQFFTYAFTGAIAFAGLFVYVSGSSHVLMQVYHLTDKQFGWIFAFLSVGLIGANQLNNVALRFYTSQQVVPMALLVQSLSGLALLVLALNGWLSLPVLIVLLFIYLSGIGFTNPNAAALSLAPFERNAGSASAMMGALQMGCGALASLVVSLFHSTSAVPMTATMCASGILALVILLIGRRQIAGPVLAGQASGVLH